MPARNETSKGRAAGRAREAMGGLRVLGLAGSVLLLLAAGAAAQSAEQADPDDPFYGLYEVGWALEPFVFVASLGGALWGAYRYFPFGFHRLFARLPNPGLGLVRATLLLAAPWFYLVLATGAASDIVDLYDWAYAFLAYACLLLAGFGLPILELYHLADVVERGNLAAGLALSGFLAGTAFAFGGALTGEGPGWWVVVAFFLLAYLELRLNVGLVARLGGGLGREVRLLREPSAGLLLGAVAAASGLVAGRAAAGDFLGWEPGLLDYGQRLAPMMAIPLVASLAGFLTRERAHRLALRCVVAAALLAYGAYFFLWT